VVIWISAASLGCGAQYPGQPATTVLRAPCLAVFARCGDFAPAGSSRSRTFTAKI